MKPFKYGQTAAEQRKFDTLWGRFKGPISTKGGWYEFKRDVMAGKHGKDAAGKWGVISDIRRVYMNRGCTANNNKREKKRMKDTEQALKEVTKRLQETEKELKEVREELEEVRGELEDNMPLTMAYPNSTFGKKVAVVK